MYNFSCVLLVIVKLLRRLCFSGTSTCTTFLVFCWLSSSFWGGFVFLERLHVQLFLCFVGYRQVFEETLFFWSVYMYNFSCVLSVIVKLLRRLCFSGTSTCTTFLVFSWLSSSFFVNKSNCVETLSCWLLLESFWQNCLKLFHAEKTLHISNQHWKNLPFSSLFLQAFTFYSFHSSWSLTISSLDTDRILWHSKPKKTSASASQTLNKVKKLF